MKIKAYVVLICCALFSGVLNGAEMLKPMRVQNAPRIDGVLDDPAWKEGRELSGFRTFIPDFRKDLSEQTSVVMVYDAENLYFAFRCHDRSPDKIKASMASRDTIFSDDFVCINLDSFNDRQALYAFYVNPLGIQGDSRFASNQEDFSVDFVWESAGRLTGDGYVVEMRIPFKSIRYAGSERVEMSIFFERFISRTTEHGSIPELDPARGYAFLSQMQPLELLDIKRYTLLEILPSFVFAQQHERSGDGVFEKSASRGEFGLTGKLGLTSQLILDATWNPDFSQVESDVGQVDANLRYALFYDEKRPFFLEGSEIFNLAGNSPFQSAVHTRQIVDPLLGIKLSGKLGRKDTLASIFALDEAADQSGSDAGFYLLRYKRALRDDGYLGLFYTGREQGSDFNRLSGIDGQIRLSKAGMLSFHGFASFTDNDALRDSTGSAMNVNYDYATRNLGFGTGIYSISQGFISESGYLTRTGVTAFSGHVTPIFYPESTWLRKISPQFIAALTRDHESGMMEVSGGVNMAFLLKGNTVLRLDLLYGTEIFMGRRFDVSTYRLVFQSWLNKKFFLYIGARRGNQIRYVLNPFQGYGNSLAVQLRYLPSEKIEWESRLSYADMFASDDRAKVYDYMILRNKLTFQLNRYLFLRAVVEYNSFRKEMVTDFLASFTYIPGTVMQLGIGSLYDKVYWDEGVYRPDDHFLEMRRGLFFKASYLWRL